MQKIFYFRSLDEMEHGLGLFSGFAVQADVEQFPTSYKLCAFRKEKGYAWELDSKGQIGVDNIACRRLLIPVGKHTARNVERDHFCSRFIDVAHQSHETT